MIFIINLFTRNTFRPNLFLKSRHFCIHCFLKPLHLHRNKGIQLLWAIWTEKMMKIHYIQTIGSLCTIQHPTEWLRFSFPQFWGRIWKVITRITLAASVTLLPKTSSALQVSPTLAILNTTGQMFTYISGFLRNLPVFHLKQYPKRIFKIILLQNSHITQVESHK